MAYIIGLPIRVFSISSGAFAENAVSYPTSFCYTSNALHFHVAACNNAPRYLLAHRYPRFPVDAHRISPGAAPASDCKFCHLTHDLEPIPRKSWQSPTRTVVLMLYYVIVYSRKGRLYNHPPMWDERVKVFTHGSAGIANNLLQASDLVVVGRWNSRFRDLDERKVERGKSLIITRSWSLWNSTRLAHASRVVIIDLSK